ncbi:hypothetical protein Y032_0084g1753 [Ancylostoma ceylanicum]|nr:hypothetical protein Y032_0084g1753 [Ancylostoma ceylanicum]
MKKALQLIVRQRSSRMKHMKMLEERRNSMLAQQEQKKRQEQAAEQAKQAQQRKKPSLKEKISGALGPRKARSRKTKGKPPR